MNNAIEILPIEIWKNIFKNIKDTQTYLSLRMVCKLFYNILFDIKIFENNKLIYIYKINTNFTSQDLFHIYNKNNKFIGYIGFDNQGYTKVIDNLKINVLNNIVHYRNYYLGCYTSRFYNIKTEDKIEDKINAICTIS